MLEAIRMEEVINDVMRANPSNVYGSALSRGHYDYYRLWDVLESHGFKKLGHGNFSCVFEHHKLPNKVVKITFHEDFGYETWAKACMGEDNPYLPKIHYMNKTKLFGIYILDKLIPLEIKEFRVVKEKIGNGLSGRKCGDGIDQVVDIIRWVWGKWPTTIDLHPENMMQTVDGQVVITDPICIRNNVVIVPKHIDFKAQARSRMRDFNQRHFRELMFKKPTLPKFRA